MTTLKRTRSTLITAVGATMILAGTALAQTAPQQVQQNVIPNTAAQAPRLRLAPDPLMGEDVSKIKGTVVYGGDDKKLGSIAAVLMQPSSKVVDRLVISEGGVLGIGSHLVMLPLEQFSWDPEKAGFRIAASAEDLKGLPEWNQQLSQLPPNEPATGKPPISVTTPSQVEKPGAAPAQ